MNIHAYERKDSEEETNFIFIWINNYGPKFYISNECGNYYSEAKKRIY